jgi:LAO/AO transport system kinase
MQNSQHRSRVDPIEEWAAQIQAGDRRGMARAISAIENGDPECVPLLKKLFLLARRATVIGVTGSPGTGKSTLVEKLAVAYRRKESRVGILAVDPTSPFSGGAILGDRIRMQSLSTDEGVYIRSMATRGRLGGLAPATEDVVTILESAGYDTVMIETVGVGQDEIEVASLADITLLLLTPAMGDEVQAFKAGVMEIADIFVINKSDYAGADRMAQEIAAMLSLSPAQGNWRPPIIKTVATAGQGVEEVLRALAEFRSHAERSSLLKDREREKWRLRLLQLLRQKLFERVIHRALNDQEIAERVDRIIERRTDPHTVVEEIMKDLRLCD